MNKGTKLKIEIKTRLEYALSSGENTEFAVNSVLALIQERCKLSYEKGYKNAKNKDKKDLLKIADEGEYEDLRREVENYFAKPSTISHEK